MSSRCIKKAILTVVTDGSALLYLIPWPASSATVGDFVVKFRKNIEKQLQSYDVYPVFDRYREYSTKCVTRVSRWAQLSRVRRSDALAVCQAHWGLPVGSRLLQYSVLLTVESLSLLSLLFIS